jgi:hypothetical protein
MASRRFTQTITEDKTGNLDGWTDAKNAGTRWGYGNGFGQPSFPPPNPCAFAFNWISLVTNTDSSIVLAHADNVPGSKT